MCMVQFFGRSRLISELDHNKPYIVCPMLLYYSYNRMIIYACEKFFRWEDMKMFSGQCIPVEIRLYYFFLELLQKNA